MDDDDNDAALAHQQELDARRWQEEQAADPGYLEWLTACAVNELELNHGNHSIRHRR